MDVVKLSPILFSLLFLTSCGSNSTSNETTNKPLAVCEDSSIADQKLIRWNDGRVTKHILSKLGKARFDNYVKRNQKKISLVENNFKIPKPVPASISLLRTGGSANWGIDAIAAENLWMQNILGQNITIAVIDSGIDTQHPQLQKQLYVNEKELLNGIDDDANGLIDDIHGYDFSNKSGDLYDNSGHGTHVSGIIAAEHERTSRPAVKGVAPKSKLIVFDFLSEDGGSVFDAIASIQAAQKAGAKVINASWGGESCSRSLEATIDALAAQNILFVAAAGNESLNIDRTPMFPAAYNSAALITVGAMTADGFTAGFSNYGQRVHIVAPGTDILSTYPIPEMSGVENGTSMAAPFVSGAAALLWSAYPNATVAQIKSAILDSAKSGPYPVLSRGSLDVSAAYELLKRKMELR